MLGFTLRKLSKVHYANPLASATVAPGGLADTNQTPEVILEEGRVSNEEEMSSTHNNDNQSRLKGANSADLSSLDLQPAGERISTFGRLSLDEEPSIVGKV